MNSKRKRKMKEAKNYKDPLIESKKLVKLKQAIKKRRKIFFGEDEFFTKPKDYQNPYLCPKEPSLKEISKNLREKRAKRNMKDTKGSELKRMLRRQRKAVKRNLFDAEGYFEAFKPTHPREKELENLIHRELFEAEMEQSKYSDDGEFIELKEEEKNCSIKSPEDSHLKTNLNGVKYFEVSIPRPRGSDHSFSTQDNSSQNYHIRERSGSFINHVVPDNIKNLRNSNFSKIENYLHSQSNGSGKVNSNNSFSFRTSRFYPKRRKGSEVIHETCTTDHTARNHSFHYRNKSRKLKTLMLNLHTKQERRKMKVPLLNFRKTRKKSAVLGFYVEKSYSRRDRNFRSVNRREMKQGTPQIQLSARDKNFFSSRKRSRNLTTITFQI